MIERFVINKGFEKRDGCKLMEIEILKVKKLQLPNRYNKKRVNLK